MQTRLFCFLLVACVFLFELVPESRAQDQLYAVWGDTREGRKVYARKGCSSCHSINGVGGTLGPDLGRPFEKNLTVTQLAGVMWNHAPRMHELAMKKGIRWTPFTGSEMQDLIAYLFFLQHLDRPGSPDRGARLFDEKGCSTCHAIAGKGSRIGPDLSRLKQYRSPILWAGIMWRHAVEMEEKMREMGLEWPTFKDNEMVDLISYIRSQMESP